jgi:hypothetical protein
MSNNEKKQYIRLFRLNIFPARCLTARFLSVFQLDGTLFRHRQNEPLLADFQCAALSRPSENAKKKNRQNPSELSSAFIGFCSPDGKI